MLVDDGYKERGLSFDVSQVHFGPMLYQALDSFDIASCNKNKIFIYQKMSIFTAVPPLLTTDPCSCGGGGGHQMALRTRNARNAS